MLDGEARASCVFYPQLDKSAKINHEKALKGNISMGNYLRTIKNKPHTIELLEKAVFCITKI